MKKRFISLMVVIVFMITTLLSGVVVATDESTFYTKIQSLTTEEKAALVGIFWTYIAGYNGGSSTTTDQIINNIQNDLIAIGLNQKFIDKGISEEVLRSTINNVKNNATVVKAAIDLQNLTNSTELDNALSALVSSGIINSNIKNLASSNMIAMLDAFAAVNKPILTKDAGGTVIIKEDNLDLLVNLANIFIQSGSGTSAEQFRSLTVNFAAALNGITDTAQKNNMISVLESFKIFEAPVTLPGGGGPAGGTPPAPTPTPAPAPDTASKGQETLNNAIKDESQITPEIAKKVSDAVKTIIAAAPINENEAGKVSKAISDASVNLLQAIGKAVNDAVRNQIAQDAASLIGAISNNLSVVNTEAKAVEVILNSAEVLSNAGSITKLLNDSSSRSDVYDKTALVIGSIANAMDKITDPQKAIEVAQTLISNASKMLGSSQEAKALAKEEIIAKELAKVAEKAIEKIGKEIIASQYSGSVLKSAVTEEQSASLIRKMDEVISTAFSMENKLNEANSIQKIEKKLTIEVTKDDSAKEVQVQLPSSLMNSAAAKKLDKVDIASGIATVSMSPDAVDLAGSTDFSLSVKNADANDLTTSQKFVIGNNKAYEFNLSVTKPSGEKENVTNFSNAIEIRLPYVPAEGENTEKITVVYVDKNGKLENMVGKYDPESGSVVFSTAHFSTYIIKLNNIAFNDLSNFEWAEKQIEVMAAKGAIGGMIPGYYAPDLNVTRAQFASIIVKALGLYDESANCDFSDVKADDWYYKAAASAVKAGIIAGYPDKTFKPDANITRQDMAVMAANAMKKYKRAIAPIDTAKALGYADASAIADYARSGAAITTKYDIITGMPGNQFAPGENANRAQAAVIIYKIFNLQ